MELRFDKMIITCQSKNGIPFTFKIDSPYHVYQILGEIECTKELIWPHFPANFLQLNIVLITKEGRIQNFTVIDNYIGSQKGWGIGNPDEATVALNVIYLLVDYNLLFLNRFQSTN